MKEKCLSFIVFTIVSVRWAGNITVTSCIPQRNSRQFLVSLCLMWISKV